MKDFRGHMQIIQKFGKNNKQLSDFLSSWDILQHHRSQTQKTAWKNINVLSRYGHLKL